MRQVPWTDILAHDPRRCPAAIPHIRPDGETFPAPVIASREYPKALAIAEAIGHAGHAPGLGGGPGRRTRHAQLAWPLTLGLDTPREPFEPVPTLPPPVIHRPPLPLQEHVEAAVTIAYPGGGEVPQPHPQRGLIPCDMAIPRGGAMHRDGVTYPPSTHLEADLHARHTVTALGRLESFFLGDVLPQRLVQRQVGHRRLALAVLSLLLAQAPQFSHAHAGQQAFPAGEPLLTDPERAADLRRRGSRSPRRTAYRICSLVKVDCFIWPSPPPLAHMP
jgi:hypothetical protein